MKPLSLEDVEKITNDVIAKDATTPYNDCLDAVIAGIYDLGLARGLGEMFSEDEGARLNEERIECFGRLIERGENLPAPAARWLLDEIKRLRAVLSKIAEIRHTDGWLPETYWVDLALEYRHTAAKALAKKATK